MQTFQLLEDSEKTQIPVGTFYVNEKEKSDFRFVVDTAKPIIKKYVENLTEYGKGFSFAHDDVNFMPVAENRWSVYGYYVDNKNLPKVFYLLMDKKEG